MYEPYTRQPLPSKEYRELLGTALCVFNANNAFVVENILRVSGSSCNWYDLIDLPSGALKKIVKDTIAKKTNVDMAGKFSMLVQMRNRIVHSYQVTYESEQILSTLVKSSHQQFHITKEYLMDFIQKNEELCSLLHDFRTVNS